MSAANFSAWVPVNHQILEVIDTVRAATDGRGVYVIDRGGDRMKLFGPFLDRKMHLVALVVASAYLAAVWLGEGLRLAVLRRMVTTLSKRFFGVPQFHYYALADGSRTILTRLGRWTASVDDLAPPQPQPRQLCLF